MNLNTVQHLYTNFIIIHEIIDKSNEYSIGSLLGIIISTTFLKSIT